MADPIPATPGAPAPNMTRWQALRMAGWIQGIDFAVIGVLLAHAFFGIIYAVFLSPTVLYTLLLVAQMILVAQVWIVILVFRCMDFVLSCQADINLMPEAAARIVMAYYRSQPKPPS